MNQNRDELDNQMFLWLALLVIVLVVIPAIYAAKAGYINGLLLALAKIQLKPFVPFSDEAQIAWAHITGLEPESLSWEQMQGVLRYTGKWVRWPLLLLLAIIGAVAVFMSRVRSLVRRLNMESLLRNNAETFPCLRPIVGRGKYLLSPASYDAGPWRIARTPVQFALEQGLLLNERGSPFLPEQGLKNGMASTESPAYGHARLDEGKALAVLKKQLGPPFTGFDGLSDCRRAAAAAFIAYADGNKKECVAILDEVATSYSEKDGELSCPVLAQDTFASRLLTIWEQHQAVLTEPSLVRHAAFELPWFMALLTRARRKGVLAGSQFLWLRPLDRPLWYTLNQCGGRAAWAESFAAWAQYQAEEKAGKTLHEPHIGSAVICLREALAAQGWLTDAPSFAPAPQPSGEAVPVSTRDGVSADSPIEPVPEIVLADAEDDPEFWDETQEYDANTDPTLAQEMY